MLPLFRYRRPDDPVLLLANHAVVTAADFFCQVQQLATALPSQAQVINLCESRHAFMLGFAAALVRGQTTLLPPGRGRTDWEHARALYPQAYVLSDQPLDAEAVFDLTPFLHGRAATTTLHLPGIPAEQPAAILFTSGSTGEPTLHSKTWGQLWHGAAHLATALQWPASPTTAVVGSVPPQHMFGLESTVMLPWHTGVPVHGQQPLLAADLESALADCARPAWWMSTPTHLRAPLNGATRLTNLDGVLVSTMSLPAALAKAAEAAWQVPVLEIYGSTETGALAIRRTATQTLWQPLPEVSLQCEGQGDMQKIYASGSHIGAPVQLGDRLDIQADGRFLWLSRASDLVKVGGKRASLSALNASLAEIAGVKDGVFFVPDELAADEAHPTQRLLAFYVARALTEPAVLAALRARIDPVFLPRPLYRVAQLPRNVNGKLSRAALGELLAQCKAAAHPADNARMTTSADFTIAADHPALAGHFPGEPIVPGVVILSQVAHAIGQRYPHAVLGTLHNARFHRPLLPGQACRIDTRLNAERVSFEVHQLQATNEDNSLIAHGQWACHPSALDAAERP